jgi:hypothetical protein
MVRSCVVMRSLHFATVARATRASSTRARSFTVGPPWVPSHRSPILSKSSPAHGSTRARSLGLGFEYTDEAFAFRAWASRRFRIVAT